eukprot:Gb_16534 [translate_table: standard]
MECVTGDVLRRRRRIVICSSRRLEIRLVYLVKFCIILMKRVLLTRECGLFSICWNISFF